MNLKLKNIGCIKEASVEIKGITVIAGENNTGKSIVGKTLFAVFNSFCGSREQIYRERVKSIANLLDVIMYANIVSNWSGSVNTKEIAETIVSHIDRYRKSANTLKGELYRLLAQYDDDVDAYRDSIEENFQRIYATLLVSDGEIIKSVLEKKLQAEFYGQINNVFAEEKGEIQLQVREKTVNIKVVGNSVVSVDNSVDLHTEVIYFDDPFILDEKRSLEYSSQNMRYVDHSMHLKYKLFDSQKESNIVDEIIVNNKIEKIYSMIDSICSGEIITVRRFDLGYRQKNSDKVLNVRNLSAGLKTFIILKMLLANGTIEYNGTIILDEPEIHLHPQWQLLFAELIVLIQREFNINVMINTHSPYFLNAIEVYAAKYGVEDKCKYYLTSQSGDLSVVRDVTDNIEAIYSKLARPLQILENEMYYND